MIALEIIEKFLEGKLQYFDYTCSGGRFYDSDEECKIQHVLDTTSYDASDVYNFIKEWEYYDEEESAEHNIFHAMRDMAMADVYTFAEENEIDIFEDFSISLIVK